MTISVGDKMPSGTLMTMGENGPEAVSTDEMFGGKKVVLFGLPGAFTPTCSAQHVPSYVENHTALAAKGIDAVGCMAVNDAFVMYQWGQSQKAENVFLLPDGNAEFTRKMGMLVEKENLGFGMRSWRYSMVVEDGEIVKMFVEDGFGDNVEDDPFEVSDADTMIGYVNEYFPKALSA